MSCGKGRVYVIQRVICGMLRMATRFTLHRTVQWQAWPILAYTSPDNHISTAKARLLDVALLVLTSSRSHSLLASAYLSACFKPTQPVPANRTSSSKTFPDRRCAKRPAAQTLRPHRLPVFSATFSPRQTSAQQRPSPPPQSVSNTTGKPDNVYCQRCAIHCCLEASLPPAPARPVVPIKHFVGETVVDARLVSWRCPSTSVDRSE